MRGYGMECEWKFPGLMDIMRDWHCVTAWRYTYNNGVWMQRWERGENCIICMDGTSADILNCGCGILMALSVAYTLRMNGSGYMAILPYARLVIAFRGGIHIYAKIV